RASTDGDRENLLAAAILAGSRLRGVCVHFLSIESSVGHGEESCILPALDHRDSDAFQIALVVETRIAQKFGVLRVDLPLRRPLVKFDGEGRAPKLREIHKRDGAGIRWHGREDAGARGIFARSPALN